MEESVMMTVEECAKEWGKPPQAVRERIKLNLYPEFSRGVPPSGKNKNWSYDIFRFKFREFIGKEKTSEPTDQSVSDV